METSIIIDVGVSYTRLAILEDDQLVDIFFENNFEKQIQGTIYQGSISNVVKGMKAAFINIGQAKKAFLHYKDIPEQFKGKLQNNQRMMVQVVKEGAGDKGPKVTAFINIPGKYIVLLPFEKSIGISRKIEDEDERKRLKNILKKNNPKQYGAIIRTGASKASTEALVAELEELIAIWENVETKAIGAAAETILYQQPSLAIQLIREYANRDIKEIVINDKDEANKIISFLSKDFDQVEGKIRIVDYRTNLYGAYNIDRDIEKALKKQMWLKSGANIVIEQTEAMNVIDVNSAKLVNIRQKDKAVLKANLQAAIESAKQIRLRNLSGIIIIDFIDMDNKEHQRQVVETLELELTKSKIRSRVFPMTELGLVQITRQRKNLSLSEQITRDCRCCQSPYKNLSYEYSMVGIEKDIRDMVRESIHRTFEIKGEAGLINYIKNNKQIKTALESRYNIELLLIEDNILAYNDFKCLT